VGSGVRWLVVALMGLLLLTPAAAAAPPSITEFNIGITSGSGPDGIAAGADGGFPVESQPALLLLRAVALEAVFGEDRLDVAGEVDRTAGRRRKFAVRGEEARGEE